MTAQLDREMLPPTMPYSICLSVGPMTGARRSRVDEPGDRFHPCCEPVGVARQRTPVRGASA